MTYLPAVAGDGNGINQGDRAIFSARISECEVERIPMAFAFEAHTERLARVSLLIGASSQPDRAVAVLEIFLLVSLESELVDPAINGVATVDGEGHNRIITPVFVPPRVQRTLLRL